MSDPNEEQQSQPSQPSQPQPDLANELRELGSQLEHAVRSALNSEPAKSFQRDLSSGLQEVGKQMQSALKAIQENQNLHGLTERGQQAINQVHESQIVKDLQETLATGISKLTEQLSNFTTRIQNNTPKTPEPPASQDIPIETDDKSATGETIRLDPDK